MCHAVHLVVEHELLCATYQVIKHTLVRRLGRMRAPVNQGLLPVLVQFDAAKCCVFRLLEVEVGIYFYMKTHL